MSNYIIYIGNKEIVTVSGGKTCSTCFEAATTIAEMTYQTASLVCSETGEVVLFYTPEEEEYEEEEYEEPADIDDDYGFDPYAGCYTYDC